MLDTITSREYCIYILFRYGEPDETTPIEFPASKKRNYKHLSRWISEKMPSHATLLSQAHIDKYCVMAFWDPFPLVIAAGH